MELLEDMMWIADEYGPGDSFPYNENFPIYEMYKIFKDQILIFCGVLLGATLLVTAIFVVYP
jgi:hypothetical protein